MDKTPVKLYPAFKDYLWGGRKLVTSFNKKCSMERVAESWELSTHKDGQSVVAEGRFAGMTLSEYIKNNDGCMGTNAEKFDYFPILIKFIDAYDNLSVQVHPDDEYAMRVESEYGKTEMWYILECDEGASLYYGVNREVTKQEFKQRIEDNTILEVLNKVQVKKGDVFFIPSGTIHAIGKGIMICEIQQNSNTTYRIYDYDRRDKDGNARELHIDKALEVTNLKPSADIYANDDVLARCKYFTVMRYDIETERTIKTDTDSFRAITVTDGCGTLEMEGKSINMAKGDTLFVPAQNGGVTVKGKCAIVVSMV